MQRLQAYKFRLKTNPSQERKLGRYAGSCRFVWNRALAEQKARHEAGEAKLGYAGLCKEITGWRTAPETEWLGEAPSQALQQSVKDLERAYKNFFEGRAAFPKFKKRGAHDAMRFPDGFKVDEQNSRLFLPKLGWVRYHNSRAIEGAPRNITVSRSGGIWFASIQTEREVETPRHPATSMIGVDMGVAQFATLSDGTAFAPVNSLRKAQARLSRAQRAVSRKKKFGANWRKAKAKVGRIHAKVAATRNDFLHKTTSAISKNHAIVVVEDLQVGNMSRSAAGTPEAPGKNVRAKAGLNRAILDQGWAEARRQLEYKQAWQGGLVIAVPPQNTSRACRMCGHSSADNRQTQARFACVRCGHTENADFNAACNILAAGHAVLACGEWSLDHSAKQEPTIQAALAA